MGWVAKMVLFVVLSSFHFFSFDAQSCRTLNFGKVVPGHKLTGPVLYSVLASFSEQCTSACFADPRCKFYNVRQTNSTSSLSYECELLDSEHKFTVNRSHGTSFRASRCRNEICSNGGSCFTLTEKTNDSCVCSGNYTGPTCRDVKCSETWTSFKSSCFKTFQKQAMWRAAQKQCESLGSNLVSVKSVEEQDFVSTLQVAEGRGHSSYWLGLRTTSTSIGNYSWVDGKQLGTFQPWAGGKLPVIDSRISHCVVMLKGNVGEATESGQWNSIPCNSTSTHFICQMDVS